MIFNFKTPARLLLAAVALLTLQTATAAGSDDNARQARRLFDQVYRTVFGPEGSTLRYDVNIIGVYRTHGTIWYKGKKSHFVEPRYTTWNDGRTTTSVDRKKREVHIYDTNDDSRDTYLSKFKYNLNDFDYSWRKVKEGIELRLHNRHAGFKGIRQVRAVLDGNTHAPLYLRIKVAVFWTTVKISNFRSGGIDDKTFAFPAASYRDYKTTDHRKH